MSNYDPETGDDLCATCGLPNVLDGTDPTAHWDKPWGGVIVAWTCSEECSQKLEQCREDNELPLDVRRCQKCGKSAVPSQPSGRFWTHGVASRDNDHMPDIPVRSK